MTCDPAACLNGKCRATGECVERSRPGVEECCSKTVLFRCPGCPHSPAKAVFLDGWFTQEHERRRRAPRTIIAFTGLAGAGKSTAAAHLVKRHGFVRIRFAGPLKNMLAALGCSQEQIDGSEKEAPCDLLGGKTPRYAMQTLGTEWGRDLIVSDLWIRAWKAAVAKVPAGVPVVIDDLRFPNEAEAVRAVGGVIVRIERPGAGTTSTHVSEAHAVEVTETLRNVADEQHLCDLVDTLVRDLSWRDPRAA